ncbi:hypothetical protein [Bradyrhizobium monzae]|uniref:hypothetical protein n=1 Tax=Bradyrhizobium sp. Oc8 TaxID=2876780 RepID=UPI001F1A41FD|nr:hypothetical protein [Bradyrhizobium sp. Oc8]
MEVANTPNFGENRVLQINRLVVVTLFAMPESKFGDFDTTTYRQLVRGNIAEAVDIDHVCRDAGCPNGLDG